MTRVLLSSKHSGKMHATDLAPVTMSGEKRSFDKIIHELHASGAFVRHLHVENALGAEIDELDNATFRLWEYRNRNITKSSLSQNLYSNMLHINGAAVVTSWTDDQ